MNPENPDPEEPAMNIPPPEPLPGPLNPAALPDLSAFRHQRQEIEKLGSGIANLLRTALNTCQFHTVVQGICLGAALTTSVISCSVAWYVTLFTAAAGLPSIIVMGMMAGRISSLFDAYDVLWEGFGTIQERIMRENPNTFVELRYVVGIFPFTMYGNWMRRVAIFLGLFCFVLFTLLVIVGPTFLCGKLAGGG